MNKKTKILLILILQFILIYSVCNAMYYYPGFDEGKIVRQYDGDWIRSEESKVVRWSEDSDTNKHDDIPHNKTFGKLLYIEIAKQYNSNHDDNQVIDGGEKGWNLKSPPPYSDDKLVSLYNFLVTRGGLRGQDVADIQAATNSSPDIATILGKLKDINKHKLYQQYFALPQPKQINYNATRNLAEDKVSNYLIDKGMTKDFANRINKSDNDYNKSAYNVGVNKKVDKVLPYVKEGNYSQLDILLNYIALMKSKDEFNATIGDFSNTIDKIVYLCMKYATQYYGDGGFLVVNVKPKPVNSEHWFDYITYDDNLKGVFKIDDKLPFYQLFRIDADDPIDGSGSSYFKIEYIDNKWQYVTYVYDLESNIEIRNQKTIEVQKLEGINKKDDTALYSAIIPQNVNNWSSGISTNKLIIKNSKEIGYDIYKELTVPLYTLFNLREEGINIDKLGGHLFTTNFINFDESVENGVPRWYKIFFNDTGSWKDFEKEIGPTLTQMAKDQGVYLEVSMEPQPVEGTKANALKDPLAGLKNFWTHAYNFVQNGKGYVDSDTAQAGFKAKAGTTLYNDITGMIMIIFNSLTVFINLITMIVLAINGIKYIFADINGKAKIKENLIKIVVGISLIYIGQALYNFILTMGLNETQMSTAAGSVGGIWGIISKAAGLLAMAGVTFIGLSYLFANEELKASIKTRLIPLAIGVIFVYSSYTVIDLIVTIARQMM